MPKTRIKASPPVHRVIRPLRDFLASQTASGILLVGAATIAMIWANSPWKGSYHDLWNTATNISVGTHHLELDLRHWVNDGLMTIFFFVVGLEIKRELVEGELNDRRRAALPVIAAFGGMVVPALLYAVLNIGGSGARGWGIPMATDIAMALGVLALVGSTIHPTAKLFLLALAIVDDIGAIIVIAVFYSSGISLAWSLSALGLVGAVLVMRKVGVYSIGPYVVVGTALWFATHEAGIHATLAGVVLGLLAPTHPIVTTDLIDEDVLIDVSSYASAEETVRMARQSVSVVEWLENRLHPWSAYVIVPLFALANAGITLDGNAIKDAFSSRITAGVVVGLVIGKPLGITLASWLAVRTKVASLPEGLTWPLVGGLATLAGIGFTVSLFVAGLGFDDPSLEAQAKVGILAASVVAALLGAFAVRRNVKRTPTRNPLPE